MLTISSIILLMLFFSGEGYSYNECRDLYDTVFKCSEKECIDQKWVCDGNNDCDNGLDEVDCFLGKCADNKFQCTNGLCIYEEEECDGFLDCDDGIDEVNCSSSDTMRRSTHISEERRGKFKK